MLSAFIAGYWTGSEPTAAHAATFASRWLGFSPTQGKQDRLIFTRAALHRSDRVQTIERIGKDKRVVIYRDSKGVVVFRNDPAAATTTAVKGVIFPPVPVHGSAIDVRPPQSAPERMSPERTSPPQKLIEGCEPALSPLASREASAFGGRCLALYAAPQSPRNA
ncbi:hypothetical protein [Gaiella sp.]|uniref:hypothetical protein n=1 Tax=Gaiella sp. TaxID=2663207 RepID=UPI002E367B11|nr:hypothetical protein [Gaiella sp.]HEX5585600.1 hypothetical protein [Gaiella sp.]